MPSVTVENYLKQVCLEQTRRGGDELVPMGRLAEAVGVTPGTATTMVKSLAEADLSGRAGIPVWQRLFGMRWRVLWSRMRERMNAYDRPRIESRLDDLAKQSVLDGSSAPSGRS